MNFLPLAIRQTPLMVYPTQLPVWHFSFIFQLINICWNFM